MFWTYTVDFVSLPNRLITEVNDECHFSDSQQMSDNIRTEYLKSRGFQVVKSTNQQVINEINTVKVSI